MVVEITPVPQFQYGAPKSLFEVQMAEVNANFVVPKDGFPMSGLAFFRRVCQQLSISNRLAEVLFFGKAPGYP